MKSLSTQYPTDSGHLTRYYFKVFSYKLNPLLYSLSRKSFSFFVCFILNKCMFPPLFPSFRIIVNHKLPLSIANPQSSGYFKDLLTQRVHNKDGLLLINCSSWLVADGVVSLRAIILTIFPQFSEQATKFPSAEIEKLKGS